MQFQCPSCAAPMNVNPPKPGRFNPKCPKCGVPFVILIQINPPDPVVAPPPAPVSAPPPRRQPAPVDADRTFASAPEADADRTFASTPAQDEDTDRTFASAPPAAQDADATFATGGNVAQNDDFDRTSATGADDADSEATGDFDTEARAKKAKPPAKKKAKAAAPDEDPDALGGYEILKRLGKGGMGSVYLARQVSLDRAVALKVMNAEFAADPVFLARFVREAYAAAQLTHHNVVQIYDIGDDDGTSFFSMEFVDGLSLGDLLKKQKAIPPAEAVGYVLQAAGGLRFAHDRGMVHRDIKPDNLMLNKEGIVKVADLGLVKTRTMTKADDAAGDGTAEEELGKSRPGSMLRDFGDMTRVGSAMGSPSYMAPEQCRDASGVDARADIYSLGCSLYALLAGRAPFTGASAMEVISKHMTEPPPPLKKVAASVPADLAVIVDKTLMKDPADRFQSMDEFIAELKDWQANQASGPPRPTEEQLAQFETLVKTVRAGGKAGQYATFAALGGLAVGAVALPFSLVGGSAVLLATIAAVVAGVVTSGVVTDSYLFRKGRQWAAGARIVDWLTAVVSVILFVVALYFAGLLGVGLAALAGGTGVGVAFGLFVAKPAHDKLLQSKEAMDGVLKRVRLAGVDEDGVRSFAIDAAGDRWEQVYELLFGYPAKVQARATHAEKVAGRPKYAAWRDGWIAKFDAAADARKQAKDKKLLLTVETARLEAEGVAPEKAKAQALDAADDLVEQAVDIKAANTDQKKKVNVRAVMSRYDRAKMAARPPRPRANPLAVVLKKVAAFPFDPRFRLLLGALLFVAGFMWVKQNAGPSTASAEERFLPLVKSPDKFAPLVVNPIPAELTSWVNSVNVLAAGLLAVLSLFVGRAVTLLVMAAGAAVAVVGYQLGLPIPEVGPLKPVHLCGIGGLVIGLVGYIVLGQKR